MIDKRCVVILGAGASRPFGVPLASELLDKMLHSSGDRIFREKIKELKNRFNDPPANLEEVLTIIRIREFAGEIPKPIRGRVNLNFDIPDNFEKNLYVSLKELVYRDKRTKDYKSAGSHPWHGIFRYCDRFATTTWGNFNWDSLLTSSFYHWSNKKRSMRMHRNIQGVPSRQEENHYLLKLHGGINLWWHESNLKFELPGKLEKRWTDFRNDDPSSGIPAILEPSGFKYQDSEIYNLLKPQWDDFKCELKKASAIIIIGYSLPDLDPEAKKCLEAATSNVEKVIVFDPCDSVYRKYKNIFGERKVSHKKKDYGNISDRDMENNLLNWYDPASE